MTDETLYCEGCGTELVLAAPIDYYCPNPDCNEDRKVFEKLMKAIRELNPDYERFSKEVVKELGDNETVRKLADKYNVAGIV